MICPAGDNIWRVTCAGGKPMASGNEVFWCLCRWTEIRRIATLQIREILSHLNNYLDDRVVGEGDVHLKNSVGRVIKPEGL